MHKSLRKNTPWSVLLDYSNQIIKGTTGGPSSSTSPSLYTVFHWINHITNRWECTLFFKRNATFLNPFFRWPWVTDPDGGSCTFCQMVLRVTCKKPHYDIPHGSLAILTCSSTCHFGLMTKQLKSHCNQCKLDIFSKWCISFGHECMVFKSLGILFNSAVFQEMF